jgi:protein involved in polysaccharide export with SLBB domain
LRRAILILALLPATLLSAGVAQAQVFPRDEEPEQSEIPPLRAPRVDTLSAREQERAAQQALLQAAEIEEDLRLLVDRPVDRHDYVLGPGDQVAISTSGEANLSWTLTVTPEGTLLIPTVGVVPVRGLNLEEAEEVVEGHVLQYYRNIDLALTLAGVQGFKVFVVGAVVDPGPRLASAATRVSELVPPRRNIFVQRSNGDTLLVDVVRFRQTGDLAYNPTVRSGDVIVVRQVDQGILVQGRVFFPGLYEYREGETLAELLRVANGYRDFPVDAHDVVHVNRFVSQEERELLTFRREEALGPRGQAFALQPFDAIFVPRVGNFRVLPMATVDGEVRYPGTFPIRPDTTTIRELVEMAGGFTEEASLAMAELRRQPVGETEEGLEALEEVPAEFLTDEERRILSIRRSANATSVVIDLEDVHDDVESGYDVPLRDGDVLTVPEHRAGVTVLGAVLNPGIIRFAPRREVDDYVRLAGGYTDKADKGDVVVVKGKTETILERDEIALVESGDSIIVPFEEPRDWWELYIRASTVVTGVLSVILTYIAATR